MTNQMKVFLHVEQPQAQKPTLHATNVEWQAILQEIAVRMGRLVFCLYLVAFFYENLSCNYSTHSAHIYSWFSCHANLPSLVCFRMDREEIK
jgi:hypothetical protein